MKYLYIFFPVLLAFLVNAPTFSFLLAWSTSLLFLILSIAGKIVALPTDMPLSGQLFRPFIFSQILFFGYNSTANIFYFMDLLGYYYLQKTNVPVDTVLLSKLAVIQNYMLLAHAVYLCGASSNLKYYVKKSHLRYQIILKQRSYLIYSMIFILLAFLLRNSSLAFFSYYLNSFGLFLGLFYCINSLRDKKHLPFAVMLLAYLVVNALLTGMKESIIVIIIFLMVNLYTIYKWKPIVVLTPFLLIFGYYYPSINNNYRKLAWDEGIDAYDAAAEVLKQENVKDLTLEENNWKFLVSRLSEVSMTIAYFDYVPEKHDYYGFEIIVDGVKLLVPRILFPDKGSPDISAMKRATDAGAINLNENDYTSAKPQTLSDAYMSGGIISVIITFFIFGWLTTKISIWCEKAFGGYEFGSILIFQSFFSIFNKGACFENLIGGIFWPFVMVLMLRMLLLRAKIIVRK